MTEFWYGYLVGVVVCIIINIIFDAVKNQYISMLLNDLYDENNELKKEVIKWKSKYFEAMDTVINEYSTNIKEDMEELEKEVWGDVE